jgi:hypothetical protein
MYQPTTDPSTESASSASAIFESGRRMSSGEVPPPPVATLIRFRMVAMESGSATLEVESDPARHSNPMDTPHGPVAEGDRRRPRRK